jgi:flagellar motor switch protein FliN/FliY
MSTLFQQKVDISPPSIDVLGLPPKKLDQFEEDIIIEVSFHLSVGNLIDSNMIQLIPLSFAKEMIQQILYPEAKAVHSSVVEETVVTPIQEVAAQTTATSEADRIPNSQSPTQTTANANVQKVEYAAFSEKPAASGIGSGSGNIDMLFDIPLGITVELGRTEMQIRKILELGPGAVIQLDKLAGEPVDILANHKLIAKGEVVVIEENFGVRITDIISPVDRLTKMTR